MAEKKKGIRIVIVVEDEMLDRFCREALRQLGYHRKEIRVQKSPKGQGSGKQWVDQRFVTEVIALRRKRDQALAVLVGSDVDEMSLSDRENNLQNSLREAGVDARNDGERIAYWLPKWSIETWLKHFNGDDVDENTRYKHQVKNPAYRELADTFVRQFQTKTSTELPALQFAFAETRRIEA